MTEHLHADPDNPAASPDIVRAAELLRSGRLVAFPTETVYGLGAHAMDPDAVRRIFMAKRRPSSNPLIVHLPDAQSARALAAEWPAEADLLARAFWPGPLTLVLPKQPAVPDIVTAHGPTVALRVPAHPVALALLAAAGVPVAAPSANRSTRLSPTCAQHVLKGLGPALDAILDGGPCKRGLESTVLDLSNPETPRILRPGPVGIAEIEAALGRSILPGHAPMAGPARSPGQDVIHYAPHTPVELVDPSRTRDRIQELRAEGHVPGFLTCAPLRGEPPCETRVLPPEPAAYASGLYAALHDLDEAGLDVIVIELPPSGRGWEAVLDRLARAARQGNITGQVQDS